MSNRKPLTEDQRIRKNAHQRAYYQEHKDHIKAYTSAYTREHPEMARASEKKWRSKHPGSSTKKTFNYRVRLKLLVLSAYGGKCECCGEEEIGFLTIDHIDNNGYEHRKQFGNSTAFYKWLKENNYPPGYRVLCWNCNCGRQHNGKICPHVKPKGKLSDWKK